MRTLFAGRTDRGVHAIGQVASCDDVRPGLRPDVVMQALNAHLPDDMAVLRVERRPDGFHPRYDAVWREYRYRLWSGVRQPLARETVWQRSGALDLNSMKRAAALLIGEHDLASFAGGGEGVPWSDRRERARGTVRRVFGCDCRTIDPWWGADREGHLIEVRVVADGFLPRMVRNIVGSLVEVGRGAREASWMPELLAVRDRRAGPMAVPPHGLTLWRVGYDEDVPDSEHTRSER